MLGCRRLRTCGRIEEAPATSQQVPERLLRRKDTQVPEGEWERAKENTVQAQVRGLPPGVENMQHTVRAQQVLAQRTWSKSEGEEVLFGNAEVLLATRSRSQSQRKERDQKARRLAHV